jgi:DNA segregation ATPase FtsK/SpoIIIE-like protein
MTRCIASSKLKEHGEPNYVEGILEGGTVDGDEGSAGAGTGEGGGESDPLYDQAVEIVIKNRRASISLVQRHLRIGYNRAARLLEQMEQSGLVSAMSSTATAKFLCRRATRNESAAPGRRPPTEKTGSCSNIRSFLPFVRRGAGLARRSPAHR